MGLFEDFKTQALSTVKLHYVGGGEINKEKDINTFIDKGAFHYGIYAIPLDKIEGANIRTETQMHQHLKSRVTATRLLTLGVFALAAPKRKTVNTQTTTEYLSIDYLDKHNNKSALIFSGSNIKRAYDSLYKYGEIGNNVIASSESNERQTPHDPTSELKKWKQLMDDGIISEEEFDQKKKQLLGI